MSNANCARPAPSRLLILGGGFGGVYAALELEKILAWCFAKDFACVTDGQRTREPARSARAEAS